MRNNNRDTEKCDFDWNLLNGMFIIRLCSSLNCDSMINLDGAGWEPSVVCFIFFVRLLRLNLLQQGQSQMLARIQNEQNHADRRRDRDEKRRSGMVPPSPALVRHGSKHGVKLPAALTPGQLTPHSTQAQLNISIGNNQRSAGVAHPYAAVGIGVGHEYNQNHEQFKHSPLMQQQPRSYGRQSPMVPSFAGQPQAMHSAHVDNQGGIGQDYQQADLPPKSPLLRILTCRC